MLMSEFSYTIYYLAGPQNHLGDYLSRAVELPTEAWERVGAGADTEDRFAFPFLHVWPGIWSETIRHHTTEEIIFLCLQQVDSIDGEACGVDTSSLLSSAQIEERRSEARAQTADELEDCQPHNAFMVSDGLHRRSFTSSSSTARSVLMYGSRFLQELRLTCR